MMDRICAIHQPNFFPWLGFFDKMNRADEFVFLNLVDYEKSGKSMQSITNRVGILLNGEKTYIHAPVVREHGPQPIDTVQLRNETDWKKQLLAKIEVSYAGAPYYKEMIEIIEPLCNFNTDYLSEFNIHCISSIANVLRIETRLVRQDELNVVGHSNELLIGIVQAVGCNVYLHGSGGNNYQDRELFEKNGICLMPQNYVFPEYCQTENGFVPGLSIIDTLAYNGIEKTCNLLKGNHT